MNIALFDATPHWSGGSKRVLLLAKGLKELGHSVFVICLSGSLLSKKCAESNIRYLNINPVVDIDPVTFVRIYSFIKKEKIRIVDLNSPKFYWLGTYAATAAGAKTVITRNVPFRKKGLKKFINGKFLYNNVDYVVAISEEIRRSLIEDFKIKNIITIYDGIPQQPPAAGGIDALRKRLGITGKPVIGIFGRVYEGKGHSYLIEALKEVKKKAGEIKLVVVGTGDTEYIARLKKKIADYGLEDNVLFAGFRENIPEYYNAVDFVVAPTLNEGLGMNILEACSAGKPVVASNTGGVPEIISDGINGILVKPADSGSLASGIIKLFDSNYANFGANCKKIISEKFALDRMIKEYERLYSSLLSQ